VVVSDKLSFTVVIVSEKLSFLYVNFVFVSEEVCLLYVELWLSLTSCRLQL